MAAGGKQVSPAVAVIVIIIVLAIIVAVYYWATKKPAAAPNAPMMMNKMGPGMNKPIGPGNMPKVPVAPPSSGGPQTAPPTGE